MKRSIAISLTDGSRSLTVAVPEGSTAVEAVRWSRQFLISAPCGGNGTCGKCAVRIEGEGASAPDEVERSLLTDRQLAAGLRLACRARVEGPCTITLPNAGGETAGREELFRLALTVDPPVRLRLVELPAPSLADQRPDELRLLHALGFVGEGAPEIPAGLLRELPGLVREHGRRLAVLHSDRRVYRIGPPPARRQGSGGDEGSGGTDEVEGGGAEEGGASGIPVLGTAADIGTTSVAVYLAEIESGRVLGFLSEANRQASYGADVISRIAAWRQGDGGEAMRWSIIGQIEEMTERLLEEAEESTGAVGPEEVTAVAAAGNPVMLHIAAGLDPTAVGESPFVPVSTAYREYSAREIGFRRLRAPFMVLPAVSGYVGADVTAGLIAAGIDSMEKTVLYIDIGTNGEIVLKHGGRYYACSAAAGPALEGAGISCGMGYEPGAVEAVRYAGGRMQVSTVEGAEPRGLCGSGIIDAAAALLEAGWADYSGRMFGPDELPAGNAGKLPADNAGKLPAGNAGKLPAGNAGMPALVLHDPGQEGERVFFSQRDMREVQNAKAAIAAGVNTLVEEAGLSAGEVDAVYLAGGFGTFLRPASVIDLGILPRCLEGRIEQLGNTAGKGALTALLSRERLAAMRRIAGQISYIELSSSAAFMERYVEEMHFPGGGGGE